MNDRRLEWLERGQFINLTTFRKNGQAVATPVWFVWHEERVYVFTQEQSGKAKRIRANGRAIIAPSDVRGNPLGEFVPARGRVLRDEEKIKQVNRLFDGKYGIQRKLIGLMSRFRGGRQQETPFFLEFELMTVKETTG
ncbi:PPOX class F420-dependent oxidoreductase [Bellilinea sp.]|uniref:PPOX class F420-dependent oxidoreductase n=1 Tax=Bellilinea caldifistulae TaxID=360411 RepID=A0A7C4Q3F0_9CHLR|nr:PPOX class F420-dependent oxidoreductase [Bellilinea sp.]